MCAIAGLVGQENRFIERVDLVAAVDEMYQRGPDHIDVWIDSGVGLGHRRLSINDLSPAGHQPMKSHDERYVIVFNGEIYNFKELRKELDLPWRGQSDTEVVLACYSAWGSECLKRLIGMFAIAIWDRQDRSLFLARDRIGVKPLYYTIDNDKLAFASRPRALKHLSPNALQNLDEQAMRYHLEAGYIPAPYSIFSGVKKIPPAHYLIWKDGAVKIHRYWDFRSIEPVPAWNFRSENDLLDELEELTIRAVNRRLVGDVPIGAFLSGGIDSSLVAALMVKNNISKVETFTIGFREAEYDESPHAKAVADHLGTSHHCEYLGVDDLLKLIPIYQQEFDEPFFDYSAFPTMAVSRLARERVTVSLSGDGGDELFGGYHYYKIIQSISYIYRMPRSIRLAMAETISLLPGHKFALLSIAFKQAGIVDAFCFMRSISKDFESVMTSAAMNGTRDLRSLFAAEVMHFPRGLEPAEMGMRLDAMFTLPDDYLQKVDISSMAFSLESREPLLDHELIEWSMRLPLSWKLRGGVSKYLLRKLAYRHVRQEILDRPKQGFSVPIDRWLRGPLKQWALERIEDKTLYNHIPLVRSKVRKLFDLHQAGKRNVHPVLWSILMILDFVNMRRNSSR